MADPTRLELATSAVTGRRSNQLSYESRNGANEETLTLDLFLGKEAL